MTKLRKLCKPVYRRKKINKLFAGLGSVRIVKNCDLGHSFSLYGPPSRQIIYISQSIKRTWRRSALKNQRFVSLWECTSLSQLLANYGLTNKLLSSGGAPCFLKIKNVNMQLVLFLLLDMNTENKLLAFLVYSVFHLDNSIMPSSGQLKLVADTDLFSSLM